VNSIISPKPLEDISAIAIDNSVYQEKVAHSFLDEKIEERLGGEEKSNELAEENINENLEVSNTLNSTLNKDEVDEVEKLTDKNLQKDNISLHNLENSSLHEEIKLENNLDHETIEENKIDKDLDVKNSLKENKKVEETSESVNLVDENNQPTVRKLSLFDTLEDVEENIPLKTTEKTEPIFEDRIDISDSKLNEETEVSIEEFSSEDSGEDENFSQDSEEELLDIPTFLRRQAN